MLSGFGEDDGSVIRMPSSRNFHARPEYCRGVCLIAQHIKIKDMKSKLLLVIAVLWLLLPGISAQAQDAKKITGAVYSENGTGMPGVTVTEVGTSNFVLTDEKGNFSITISANDPVLHFTSVGYIAHKQKVGNAHTVSVTMVADNVKLNEVVVTGYGTQKRSDLTGAISTVTGNDIEKLSAKRVDQALQGRASGVAVQNTDGAPGGKTVIRIRGSNSVLGGNNALVVVDGLQGGDISKINPADIQSVEILKDASATAIYGSRGANGVILITTRKGSVGKPSIDYSAGVGVQRISRWLDLLDAGEYARNINAVRALDNAGGNVPTPVFTEEAISAFDKNGGTDWQKAIYRDAVIQNHQLSISGGSQSVKYFLSGGYLNQDGILLNSGYKRYALRSNVDVTFNKWLSGGINLYAVKDEGQSPAFGGESGEDDLTLQGAVIVAPLWGAVNPVYNADGSYFRHPANFGPRDTWNPVASAKEVMPSVKSTNNNANLFFNIDLPGGLKLNLSGFANVSHTNDSKFYNEKTKEGLPVDGKSGMGHQAISSYEYYQSSANLTYDKTFGDHHLNITAVAEQSSSQFRVASLSASRFTSTVNGLDNLASAEQVINSSSGDKRVLRSYLGRVNYSLKDKYLLTVSYRMDGSSVFGSNNKWGYFPSASLAWKLSEERFIKDLGVFSLLKIRGSYGLTGNQAIDPYQSLATVSSGLNYPWNGGSATNTGFGLTNPPNPNLKWESTRQTNIGLDAGLFDGRIAAIINVYRKKTDDLLLYRQLATSSGYNVIIDNAGATENKGLEIELSGSPLAGELKWNTGFNISFNRNKVISLGDNERIPYIVSSGGYDLNNPLMYLVVGEPFGQMYGWGYEGVWSSADAKAAQQFGQLPGDPRYTDTNNDGKIDIDDLKVIGNSQPKFTYGWHNKLSYKNFELDFLIQGAYGNNIFNQIRIGLEAPYKATSKAILNRWTINNQDTDVPAYIDAATRNAAGLASQVFGMDSRTGRWVEDGSYLRLKMVSLAYAVKAGLLDRIGLKNFRAQASATNLFTLTKYSGYDPEVSSYNASDAMSGVDFGNYPTSVTVSLGINCSF
ncbi:SusC/RagA family TonB-linked outer membrane protein [Chitinophaga alhagiae]|uniref:SusC/RagA family TonB-linked outer membrane protein n=1 Tax=Chitinophaga alhagiae TaxID=2203219 RepID=UPI000E5BA724|nr:TonB-dependent receptor [Chitinophaga alhagiae]